MLEISNLTYQYPDGPHFCFDHAVDAGGNPRHSGASGIGKSTLLHLIAGLLDADGGMIRWQGEDITHTAASARPLSILFQDHNLFDHLDCRTNIALGLDPKLKLFAEDNARIDHAMEKLGVSHLAGRYPDAISGGQKQRILPALVRSQVQERSLLLLDEPFSALDPETRKDSADLVRMLVRDHGLTALVVSHDDLDAETLATRVFTLSAEATRL